MGGCKKDHSRASDKIMNEDVAGLERMYDQDVPGLDRMYRDSLKSRELADATFFSRVRLRHVANATEKVTSR